MARDERSVVMPPVGDQSRHIGLLFAVMGRDTAGRWLCFFTIQCTRLLCCYKRPLILDLREDLANSNRLISIISSKRRTEANRDPQSSSELIVSIMGFIHLGRRVTIKALFKHGRGWPPQEDTGPAEEAAGLAV
ncbi:hypothetical protein AKJ16_DCAP05203 [Drosera capensis]